MAISATYGFGDETRTLESAGQSRLLPVSLSRRHITESAIGQPAKQPASVLAKLGKAAAAGSAVVKLSKQQHAHLDTDDDHHNIWVVC